MARATVASVGGDGRPAEPAVWQQRDDKGTASLTLAKPVAAGRAVIHVEYDAPFTTKLEGLFKVTQTGVPYAFTQFENIAARRAFPCFDEPGFKIPWDVTLEVPSDAKAIANTREIAREESGTSVLVHFATTLPLPSYLVAFAVGPLDVVSAPEIPPNAVRHRALPLRGVTTHGRGKEIAYALAHTGEILAILEQYFGLEYPYDKLDILAVPDMDGAMENAGALTFNDWLLLFNPKTAPSRQTRSYADVMAHELAHQWVGNLVTASWWDDIWLNEAFATWMEGKAADAWDPRTDAATIVLDGIQDAMGSDSLVSARSIRQPVTSVDDIANAFDNITYSKGGAVLGMFERWVGAAAFQRGLHAYLAQHRLGSATADDFLGAESAAAGRDVKTPFHTFLDQPGVPFVEAAVRCDGPARLHLRQTRYLPLGSSGDAGRTWQIPICARYGVGQAVMEACTLLAAAEADLELGARCPDWVFPNSGALGYFRFALAPGNLARLRASGFSRLTAHERVALGNSVRAALGRGALPVGDALDAEVPLASDPHPNVAAEPMGILRQARQWLYRDPLRTAVELYARDLFRASSRQLGWTRATGDDGDRVELRARVLGFLARTAEDPATRAEAKRRGAAYIGYRTGGVLHPDLVDADLAAVALHVLGQDADRPLWDALHARLIATEETGVRASLIDALASARRAELLESARALTFDKSLRAGEVLAPLAAQLDDPATQDDAWRWAKEHWDALLAAVPRDSQSSLVSMAGVFCDEAHAADLASFFTPARLAGVDGGPRELAKTVESVHLCAVKRQAEEPSARAFFASVASRPTARK